MPKRKYPALVNCFIFVRGSLRERHFLSIVMLPSRSFIYLHFSFL